MSAREVQQYIRGLGNKDWRQVGVWQYADVMLFVDSLYAVIERSEKGCRIVHIPSGDLLTFADFKAIFASCNYTEIDHETLKPIRGINIGRAWLACPYRHQIETIEDLNRER